jgi:hypothetical protein
MDDLEAESSIFKLPPIRQAAEKRKSWKSDTASGHATDGSATTLHQNPTV